MKYDQSLLLTMLRASTSLSSARKSRIEGHFHQISQSKREALFQILAREQMQMYAINQQRIVVNTDYLQKQTRAVNGYNEGIAQINEASVVHALDDELEHAFDGL